MAVKKGTKSKKSVRKSTPKPPEPLSAKVATFLTKNSGKTFTYNQVAKKLKVKAVAVANATRTLRKVNPTLASALITARTPVTSIVNTVKAQAPQ